MKKNAIALVLLAVAGFALLAGAGLYFQLPLFGWVILSVMLVVYVMSMERYRGILNEVESEEQLLAQAWATEGIPQLSSGLLASRVQVLQDLARSGAQVDSRVFSEVLSARESARGGRGAAGIVILLGLLGTFYGLMKSIAAAGMSLESADNQQILLAIQGIFSSMMGIFGTSLCGLLAALFLNMAHALLSSRRLAFMASVEEYTQFRLLPHFLAKPLDLEEKRAQALEKQLAGVAEALRTGMQARGEEALDRMSKSLDTSLQRLEGGLQAALSGVSEGLNSAIGATTTALTVVAKTTYDSLESTARASQGALQNTVTQALGEVNALSQAQMTQVGTQWENLAQSVQTSLASALDSLRISMEQRDAETRQRLETFIQSAGDSLQSSLEAQTAVADLGGGALREHALALQEALAQSSTRLVQELAPNLGELSRSSAELLQAQRNLLAETEKRIGGEQAFAESLRADVAEAGTLMRVNQSEFQASLEMFRSGVESLLEKFTGGSAEQESQRNFLDQLQASLEAFHEKASEVLVENALRTQEILLDVLEQAKPLPNRTGEV